jgi:hypothetical protein
MRRDPVSRELREQVFARDQWACVAPRLGAETPCGGYLTLDHVQSGYGRMGKRAPSDAAHLASICAAHHLWSGWATSHRPELRAYLARVTTEARP